MLLTVHSACTFSVPRTPRSNRHPCCWNMNAIRFGSRSAGGLCPSWDFWSSAAGSSTHRKGLNLHIILGLWVSISVSGVSISVSLLVHFQLLKIIATHCINDVSNSTATVHQHVLNATPSSCWRSLFMHEFRLLLSCVLGIAARSAIARTRITNLHRSTRFIHPRQKPS